MGTCMDESGGEGGLNLRWPCVILEVLYTTNVHGLFFREENSAWAHLMGSTGFAVDPISPVSFPAHCVLSVPLKMKTNPDALALFSSVPKLSFLLSLRLAAMGPALGIVAKGHHDC